MKLLSYQVVGFYALKELTGLPLHDWENLSSYDLCQKCEELEEGGIFRSLEIRNFLEGDLFSWYTQAWNNQIFKLNALTTLHHKRYLTEYGTHLSESLCHINTIFLKTKFTIILLDSKTRCDKNFIESIVKRNLFCQFYQLLSDSSMLPFKLSW